MSAAKDAVAFISPLGGTILKSQEQKAAQKALENSALIQTKQDDLQAARQRRDAIRAARIAQAGVVSAATNQGVQGSSAAAGGQASIQSQLQGNLSFLDEYNFLSKNAGLWQAKSGQAQSKANEYGAFMDLNSQVAKTVAAGG